MYEHFASVCSDICVCQQLGHTCSSVRRWCSDDQSAFPLLQALLWEVCGLYVIVGEEYRVVWLESKREASAV